MQPLPYTELNLDGALQLDTAIAALRVVDVNPIALKLLEDARITHQVAAAMSPNQSKTLPLHYHGDHAAIMKADLIVGLELLSSQADSPEQKIAAQALLETIRQ